MAVAAATFCSISHNYGVNKLNECLLNRINLSSINSSTYRSRTNTHENVFQINTRQLHSIRRRYRILLKPRANHDDAHIEEDKELNNVSKATLIWRAVKLPMYTVAFIPISVGSAAAYLQAGKYFAKRYFTLLISSVLVIAWLNLSNDVYDFDTGADINKKESVVNLLGSRTGAHVIAWLLLGLGFTGLTLVSIKAKSIRSIFLLAGAIICGYIYQCPPFRLSYVGMGEPLCFVAFGPLATTAFYLLQSGTSELPISGTILSSSILVGLTTSLILFCSHFHQIEDDKAVGKISPLVRLGTEGGAKVVKVTVRLLYSLLCILGLSQILPFSSVALCALTLPVGRLVVSFVEKNHKDKTEIFMAKYYCVRLHTVFGGALAAGLVAARLFARKQLPHVVLL